MISNKLMKMVNSNKCRLLFALVLSAFMMVKSLFSFYNTLDTVGTTGQWKYIASLTSYIIVLLMFLMVVGTIIFTITKELTNKKQI